MACRNSAGISYPHCNLSYGQTDGRTNGQVPVTTNCKISLGKLSRRPKERRINEQQTKNPKEKPTKSGLKRNEQWVEMVLKGIKYLAEHAWTCIIWLEILVFINLTMKSYNYKSNEPKQTIFYTILELSNDRHLCWNLSGVCLREFPLY